MNPLVIWPLVKRFAPLALIAALVLWAMIERGNARHWHKAYDGEHAAHAQTVANYRAASAQAQAEAHAAKIATEARYSALQEKTDANLQIARSDARRASDAYARLHAAPAANSGSPDAVGVSGTAQGSEGDNRSGPDAVVVARSDFDTLTDNTLRLQAAHEWAAQLEGR